MWRRLRFVVVLLVLGAALNVAVAWAAVIGSARGASGEHSCWRVHGESHFLVRIQHVGHETVSFSKYRMLVTGKNTETYTGVEWWNVEGFAPTTYWTAFAAGWPVRSLMGWYCWDDDPLTLPFETREYWTAIWGPDRWSRSLGGNQRLLFPVRPLWPGFLVNTVFYAAIFLVLYGGSRFAHAHVRSWRGRCPNCGYPRGTSSICSECGAAVMPLVTSAPTHASPPSG